jgi:S1-C subfamily serine protease
MAQDRRTSWWPLAVLLAFLLLIGCCSCLFASAVVAALAAFGREARVQGATPRPLPVPSLEPMPEQGALVVAVEPGSPADLAGLAPGDVITAVGERKLSRALTLEMALAKYRPGDRVRLTWWQRRSGQLVTGVNILLGAHPEDPDRPYLGVRYRMLP